MKYQRIYIVIAFLMSFASVLYAYDGEANNSVMATFADAPNGNTNIVASGECGEHATWSLDEDGKLTIGGYGDMYNYGRDYDEGLGFAPWLTSYAKIKSIEISEGITSIGDNTFGLGSFTTATIDVSSIILPDGIKRIGKNAFNMCKSIISIIIPNSVTVIDDLAFLNLENLTSIELSNSLISIGRAAFSSTGIDNIELPNSLTSIGDDAFDYCENLSEIAIPRSVVSIGAYAFCECINLKNITNYADQPQNITSDTFHGVTDATLHVKKGCKKEYANADVWKNFTIVEDADDNINISKIVDTILKRNGASESMSDVNNDGVVSIADVVCAIDSNKKNVHDYVDLGLSVKWATCNVGASKPEDYGGYYAWGETEEKSTYDWSTYKWCNGSETKLTKYCTTSRNGFVDNKMVLELHDDVAHVKWGGSWRMPTTEEFAELRNRNNCTWTWTSQNGVNGYRVTSVKNGNSIFLPAAYYRVDSDLPGTRSFEGFYWTSSLYTFNPVSYLADNISFYLNGTESNYHHYRSYGLSVRPVCDDAVYVSHIAFNELSIAMKVDELKAINYTVSPSDATNQEIIWSSSNEAVATVSDGIVTAKGAGTCTIRATAADGSGEYCECTLNIEDVESAYKYVNLGLSVKWATCNVGAINPEDYGDYFAWGETIGYNEGKTDFNRGSYKWCNKIGTINKYCNSINDGLPDYKTVLEPEDDVAFVKSDGFWRMPTKEEMDELSNTNNCTWTWTSQKGVNGYKVTSLKNGNSIFLPAAGYAKNSSLTDVDDSGHYWVNLLNTSGSVCAYSSDFCSRYVSCSDSYSRFNGLSIRPVYDNPDAVHVITFNESVFCMRVGAKKSISYSVTPSVAKNKILWSSSNKTVATVSDGIVTAMGKGKCTIRAAAVDGSGVYSECTVEVEPAYEYVDLGLSVKWATCNVDAEKPEDFGGYYAWGETEVKSEYTWDTYFDSVNGSDSNFNKYEFKKERKLELNDDVAHIKWGGSWRMPTKEEQEELVNNCVWTRATINGVLGYRVTSQKNENSIFLPAADYYSGSYWSSTLDNYNNSEFACCISFNSVKVENSSRYRCIKLPVRPVCDDVVYVSNISFNNLQYEMSVREKKTLYYALTPSDATNQEIIWSSSNNAIATVFNGIVTAKGAGTCTIRATSADGNGAYCECTIYVKPTFEYVDLGLSVRWATCNVGAEKPEDYGDYFAWGETYEKATYATYDWRHYQWCDNDHDYMSKYCTNIRHLEYDNLTTLELKDDAANAWGGGNWRMPTKTELDELRGSCTWTWTTLNGVAGYEVKSKKNGNSIFLPAAGCRKDDSLSKDGSLGYYWSSSLSSSWSIYPAEEGRAGAFGFDSSGTNWYAGNRCDGQSIRPVCPY